MVGLSDIPCVGKIVDRISDATVEALFRGLKYMFCYKSLVQDLNSEIDRVKTEEVRVSNKAAAARADGKIIYDDVLKWQTDMEEFHKSAEEFSEAFRNRSSWRCIQCLPIPNPVSRFQLGREAVQKTKMVAELTGFGKELLDKEFAYLQPSDNLPHTDGAFQKFESREDAYKKLWDAIVNKDSPVILGIYGMPGVGKTRMMERIREEAMEKKIFDKVTRSNVSNEKLDVIKIQKDIAGHLNCHFVSEDNVQQRASQLKSSLIQGGKILVILDDVWREIPLDIIGIPYGDGSISNGSKILFTSREEEVCLQNNCKYPVKITPLTFDEAWDLFSNVVGTSKIELLQDESLVKKVCKKCAGLPLALHAVGKTLKFKAYNSWKDALKQLENHKLEKVPGISPEVYACLKLSFDNLEEDAKSCLLLCSLFPEDADIPITMLIQYAEGSHLVHNGTSRVPAMVDILKSSSLLLEGRNDEHVKLHDIIRDLARSIAVDEPKYGFLIARCGSRLPDNGVDYRTRKLIQLDLVKNDFRFPYDMVCPDLHTLLLRSMVRPKKLFQAWDLVNMFVNVRFLDLQGFSWEQQFSLKYLGKLRTLFLTYCDMRETDGSSFFPEKLETLCLRWCSLPKPLSLPNLGHLQKLEILGDVQFVPNTLSSLSSLEELYIPRVEPILDDEGKRVPILDEISKLTRLNSLRVYFLYDEPFQNANIFSNFTKYRIHVGSGMTSSSTRAGWSLKMMKRHYKFLDRSVRSIIVSGQRMDQDVILRLEGLESLMERAEVVDLSFTHDKVSSIFNGNREAFSDLRSLYIGECNTMEHLARISVDHMHHNRTSFSRLIDLEIENCSALRFLFCNTVAKCLVQLQKLYIADCPSMVAIVVNEGTSNGDIINFSNLKKLKLKELPELKSFYLEMKDMHSGSTSILDNPPLHSAQVQSLFDETVAFPSLEILYIEECSTLRNVFLPSVEIKKKGIPSIEASSISFLEDTSDTGGKHYYSDNASFCKLRKLSILCCKEVEIVLPVAMLHRLQNLEYLKVDHCDTTRAIIAEVEQEELTVLTNSIVFPELTELNLSHLPAFASFICDQSWKAYPNKLKFPNLVTFVIAEINLEGIEFVNDDSICQLKSLYMHFDDAIQIPFTWQCQLYNLEILTLTGCWWHDLKSLNFPRLKVLKIDNPQCSALFSFSSFKSLEQLEELKISNCSLLEEIVEDVRPSGMDKKTSTLPKLKSIKLVGLPNLKSINHVKFPNLVTFVVRSVEINLEGIEFICQLKSLNMHFDNAKLLPFTWQRQLHSLEILTLTGCWWHDLESLYFPRLKVLKVKSPQCSALFSFSSFKSLEQLEELEISNCSLLEEVVEDVRPSGMDKQAITLPQLESIKLDCLPNLKSISRSVSYVFDMPNLRKFGLTKCPQADNFTSLKTGTILWVTSDWGNWETVSDLTEYIRKNRERENESSNIDDAEEGSNGDQELETESAGVEEMQSSEIEENHNQQEQMNPDILTDIAGK